MSRPWEVDKRWSDVFLPQIKQILGLYLIGEPPVEEDVERNTDLIVLRMEPARIACRVRHFEYLASYPDEFTVRSNRPTGAKTELTKIIEGWGDYFFYGFADQQEKQLVAWFLGDLKVFRLWFMRQLCRNKGQVPGRERSNKDGSSSFHAFSVDDLPQEFLIARQRYAEPVFDF